MARVAGACARAAPAAAVRAALGTLLPFFCAAASAPGADVRKAAVEGLAHLHGVLGDAVVPQLKQHLRDDQVRLVGTYVHRSRAAAVGF